MTVGAGADCSAVARTWPHSTPWPWPVLKHDAACETVACLKDTLLSLFRMGQIIHVLHITGAESSYPRPFLACKAAVQVVPAEEVIAVSCH